MQTILFSCKIWIWKEDDKNTEWINKMKKELKEFDEDPLVNIHLDSLRTTLKKILNWKTPGHVFTF